MTLAETRSFFSVLVRVTSKLDFPFPSSFNFLRVNRSSSQRTDLIETGETADGGNGISGNNEMSENLAQSFSIGVPNPGTGPGAGPTPPSISNVQINPENPTSSDMVTIFANVTDEGSVASVNLYTSINDAPFNQTTMNNISGDTYQAVVDSQQCWFFFIINAKILNILGQDVIESPMFKPADLNRIFFIV